MEVGWGWESGTVSGLGVGEWYCEWLLLGVAPVGVCVSGVVRV